MLTKQEPMLLLSLKISNIISSSFSVFLKSIEQSKDEGFSTMLSVLITIEHSVDVYKRQLHKTNNFPEFTSRVCPALCEKACTCSLYGDAVSVRDNEYSIIENAYKEGYASAKTPSVRTGKKVAVIGSGPSGLAVADQLNKRGHSVTVYERDDRVGGLLMLSLIHIFS